MAGPISYPNGHPFETDQIKAPNDQILRRFVKVGSVIVVHNNDESDWERTGHAGNGYGRG